MRRLLNRRESFLSREKTPLIVPFILQIIKKTTNRIPSNLLSILSKGNKFTEVRNLDQDQKKNKISREKFENLERNSSTSTTTNLTI